jgi:tRNA/tmRNA/rRNA uracil-C5-methylase (TrmA/RlmC/RlmD family)
MPRLKKKPFNAYPFEYHQEVELEIQTLTHQGHGLGRINGWVVMVKFSLPGELIKARIFKNHSNYSEGDLMTVLKPSPDRTEAQCPLFTQCGGCQYQHLDYQKQLEWKQNHVQTLFNHALKSDQPVALTYPSPKTYHYRSKITPHYQKPHHESFPIGFLKNGSTRHLIDVPECPIATPSINASLKEARNQIVQQKASIKKGRTLLFRDTGKTVTTDPSAKINLTVGNKHFSCIAGEFFQNNPFILEPFIEYIKKISQDTSIRYLIDAYCGVGLFSICLHDQFESIAGIEINPQATLLAKENAKHNDIHNTQFINGQAEAIFQGITFPPNETVIILDPPRKGCDPVFLDQLIAYRPKRIVYVACDPATQARDIAYLYEKQYQVIAIQPFDFFPQTKHIENIVTLESQRA